ncbi:MAG: metallophosphoesterase [Pseudomonadota bacterium]|nr:metallophosphoesterase [Pseudomonadota bacterium]
MKKNPEIFIAYGSDLHLSVGNPERSRQALLFPKSADVIVLAGDIGEITKSARVALGLADEYQNTHIIWVAGNHEFYRSNIDEQIRTFREMCSDHKRVHFLENESVDVLGLRFIGCTLWTDFSILGSSEVSMAVAAAEINDFICIESQNGSPFTPQDCAARYSESYKYLEEQLARSIPEQTVVVTHFPPGLVTRNTNYRIDAVTAYFQANIAHLIERYEPALWIYGHNHYSRDIQIGNTRIVSNQLGYQSEEGKIPTYDPKKLVHLGAKR